MLLINFGSFFYGLRSNVVLGCRTLEATPCRDLWLLDLFTDSGFFWVQETSSKPVLAFLTVNLCLDNIFAAISANPQLCLGHQEGFLHQRGFLIPSIILQQTQTSCKAQKCHKAGDGSGGEGPSMEQSGISMILDLKMGFACIYLGKAEASGCCLRQLSGQRPAGSWQIGQVNV